jgi:hypothetical protein
VGTLQRGSFRKACSWPARPPPLRRSITGLSGAQLTFQDGINTFTMVKCGSGANSCSAPSSVSVATLGGYNVPQKNVYDVLPQYLRTSISPSGFLDPVAYISMTKIAGGEAPKPSSGRRLLQVRLPPAGARLTAAAGMLVAAAA